MAGSTVVVSVLADSAKFKRDMDDIGQSTGKLTGFLGNVGKALGVALLAGTVALGAYLGASFKAVAEVERLNAQTSAVIASTAGAAGRSLEQLNSMGDSLERLTGIEAETITAGQNLLLTFTNIKGTNFDAATSAALDLSVAMGTDMTSAATLVGKALNDPIAGMSALSRVGVQLSEDQKKTIASLVELGDVAGAQAVILAELNTQFGGSAEAFGNTFLGASEKVKNSFGQIGENLVTGFLPVATDVLLKVNDLFLSIAESPAFNMIVENVSAFAAGLLDGSGAASQFAEIFQVVATVLSPFGLVVQALVPVLPLLADSFLNLGSALAGAFGTLAPVLDAVVGALSGVLAAILPVIVGLVIQLVDIFAALIPVLAPVITLLVDTLGGALQAILPAVASLLGALASALGGVLAAVLPVIVGLIVQLAEIFSKLIPVITPVIELLAGVLGTALESLVPLIALLAEGLGSILGGVLQAIVPLFEPLAEILTAVMGIITPLIDIVIALVTPFLTLLEPIGMLIGALLPPLIELLLATSPAIMLLVPLLELLTPALQFVAEALGSVSAYVAQAVASFTGLISGSSEAQVQVTAIWQGVLSFFSGIPAAIGAFFANAGTWLIEAGGNIVDGLLAGLTAAFEAVWSFIEDAAANIADTFSDVLGIQSPSTVFKALGKYTIEGLALGLKDVSSITSAVGNAAKAVVSGFDPDFGAAPAVAGPGAFSATVGTREYHIHLPVGMPTAEAGRAIVEAIDEYERLNGKR